MFDRTYTDKGTEEKLNKFRFAIIIINEFVWRKTQPELGASPGGSAVKESACSAGDPGSITGSGRSPGGGHGNPLQYSCLENPMDREAWWTTAHGVAESQK